MCRKTTVCRGSRHPFFDGLENPPHPPFLGVVPSPPSPPLKGGVGGDILGQARDKRDGQLPPPGSSPRLRGEDDPGKGGLTNS